MPDPVLALLLFTACCLSQWFRGSIQSRDHQHGGAARLAEARRMVEEDDRRLAEEKAWRRDEHCW